MRRESQAGSQYAELFHRHGDNPILTARDWPYPAHTVFNAGACQLGAQLLRQHEGGEKTKSFHGAAPSI